MASQEIKSIGIVGGGRRGLQLFKLFGGCDQTRVAYVSDINPAAPAMTAAKKAGAQALTDLQAALDIRVDYIFEVTGREEVAQTIRAHRNGQESRLITHDMAQVILQSVEDNDRRVKGASTTEFQHIQTEINASLERLEQFVASIEGIMSDLNMLSINARIEAARVGQQGRGFEVVAAEMGRSSEAVRQITAEIDQIARGMRSTSSQIDAALARLG
jgi:methyl-accepting chemotaxis protein